MSKLKPIESDGEIVGYDFYCPGCGHAHVFWVTGRVKWSFNGNMECPSFHPSLLNTTDDPANRCHLHLVDGKITYSPDCVHALAGKTIPLSEHVEP